ncbi:hypothetical protein [Svornostia abyssi]|uniref:hypothetical protein n=1 Tax=Svornostia abyssi TaxID=2898438 RepID=UPI00338DA881
MTTGSARCATRATVPASSCGACRCTPSTPTWLKGEIADLLNATAERKAGSITAAEFLRRFAGDVPWAHVDIAGTAWGLGRAYAKKGGSGFGVRMLVDLAQAHAS